MRCTYGRGPQVGASMQFIAALIVLGCEGEPIVNQHALAARSTGQGYPPQVRIPIDANDWRIVEMAIQPGYLGASGVWETSPSACLHALRFHGLSSRFPVPKLTTSQEILLALTDSDYGASVFGHQILFKSRDGLRYRDRPRAGYRITKSDESHYLQNLAGLLELGLTMDAPVKVGEFQGSLQDVVRDAVANFSLDAPELEWATVALVRALLPESEWVNKHGERCSFTLLSARLRGKRPEVSACGGVHLVSALVALCIADRKSAFLAPDERARLNSRVRDLLSACFQNQNEDGSWGVGWHLCFRGEPESPALESSGETKFLITGHLVELIATLPTDMRPETHVLETSCSWLLARLREVCTKQDARSVCPTTHAARALKLLATMDNASAPKPVR